MKNLRRLLTCLFFVFSLHITLYTLHSYASVPHLINYQGRLTDTSGKPLEGPYNLTFKIYDAENAGNLLWQETQSVLMQKGIFNVLLGGVTNLDLPFDKPYWLEIKVGDEVMSPRQQITSAGYAIRAEHGVPKGVIVMWSGRISDIPSGWALCDGANGAPDLRDKFIVGARQDESGVAKTNISGSLTQIGGAITAKIPNHTHTVPATNTGWGQSSGQFRRGSMSTRSPDDEASYADTDLSTSNSGSTSMSLLNPYYALAFIMKL